MKDQAILWLDIEAADYKTDREGAVHQIAYSLQSGDGGTISRGSFNCKPFKGDLINMPSLDVCGVTYEQIMAYPCPTEAFRQLVNILHPVRRVVVGGYNLSYDIPVFLNWWYKCTKELKKWDIKWVDYLYTDPLDVRALAINHLLNDRHKMEGFKLSQVAEYMGITVDPSRLHEGGYDLELTMQIYREIIYSPSKP